MQQITSNQCSKLPENNAANYQQTMHMHALRKTWVALHCMSTLTSNPLKYSQNVLQSKLWEKYGWSSTYELQKGI